MGKRLNLAGQRFGFWVAESFAGKNKRGQTQWFCRCDCGTTRVITANSLRTGNSTSCGCNHKPNLVGQKFEKLTVVSLDEVKGKGRRYWICGCECGNSTIASTNQLRNAIKVSCGLCDVPLDKPQCLDKLPVSYNDFFNLLLSTHNHLSVLRKKLIDEEVPPIKVVDNAALI
jgi:hypothetical protein